MHWEVIIKDNTLPQSIDKQPNTIVAKLRHSFCLKYAFDDKGIFAK